MRIVLLTEFYPRGEASDVRGGVERRSFALSQALSHRHSVTVIAVREPGTRYKASVGRVWVLRPGPPIPYRQAGGFLHRLRFLAAARKELLRQTFDVLEAENYVAHAALLTVPPHVRRRSVLAYHDVWVGEWMRHLGLASGLVGEVLERVVLKTRWGAVVANSEVTRAKLLARGVAPENVSVVYPVFDLTEVERVPAERFDHPTIVTVARLVEYKRIGDLLRALAAVRRSLPDARLVVIGSGPREGALRAEAIALGVGDTVEWRGFVPEHAAVLAALKGAHALCLPSAVEGFGIATLEAMAAGTPYVSSDIAPTREVTDGGRGGVLYPLGDVEALTQGLLRILSDRAFARQKAREGRERAAAFNFPRTMDRFEGVLWRVASGGGS